MMTDTTAEQPTYTIADYLPKMVARLLGRILDQRPEAVILFGFSGTMKWLSRLLGEQGVVVTLVDWRPEIAGYDCGGKPVEAASILSKTTDALLVICPENIAHMKAAMDYLITNDIRHLPAIYDTETEYHPMLGEEPFYSIAKAAAQRSRPEIAPDPNLTNKKLQELAELVIETAEIPGKIVEFGCFNGGSGAVLAEANRRNGSRPLILLDSFAGIPPADHGLDTRWAGSFSNNSYAEVRDKFADLPEVSIIRGDVRTTVREISGPVSLCHIGTDTLEAGMAALEHVWPILSPGGIILMAEYGSYPNCVPLTVALDRFVDAHRKEAFFFRTTHTGLLIRKRDR
jgi:O-methyltransferase